MFKKLKVDKVTNFGVVPKGTIVEVLDDDTPLHQSFRVKVDGTPDTQIFGVDKTGSAGILGDI
jgi:hypothetical protein